MKGVFISDVIHHNGSLTVPVVDWTQSMVPLLTCRVLRKYEKLYFMHTSGHKQSCSIIIIYVYVYYKLNTI